MAQLRSVNTKFWEDSWVEQLNISEKLLFLYLITNSYANLAGIYEITINRICFETGLDKRTVSNGLKRFETVRKAFFLDESFIFLPNWLKNQNLNSNMKKNVIKVIDELPNNIKIKILGNGYQTIRNDYERIRNTLLKYEVLEDEVLEGEGEEECKGDEPLPPQSIKSKFNDSKKSLSTNFKPPTIDEVKKYCAERKNKVDAIKFVDHYEARGWLLGKVKMKDWKAAVRTWERNDYSNSHDVFDKKDPRYTPDQKTFKTF